MIYFGKGHSNFLNLLQVTLLTCRRAVVFNVYRFAKFMDRSSHLIDMKRGNTVLTVNLRKKEILKKSLYCVFWILIILDQGDGTTLCAQTSASYSLPVASLCYQTSASASRVVLDGFLTFQSSTTTCECTITSSKSTTVSLVALNNLQPNHAGCGNNIRVQAGGTFFIIGCFVSGTIQISSSQPATLSFEKPAYDYQSDYCVLFDPDNSNAILTLNCNGDLNFPTSTSSTIATTTTLPSKTPTTSAQTTTQTTAQTTTIRTTPTTTTQTTTKIMTQRQTTTLTQTATNLFPVTTITAAFLPLTTTASQSLTSSILSQTIPAVGAGIVLICVIVLVVCFRYRRKYKTPSNDRTVVYVNETKINLPYSPDYKYEEGSSEIACESAAHIYDVIL